MALFRRAFARSALPVRYSEGFNPHIRLTLPTPRSVGMAGQEELLLADMSHPIPAEQAAAALAPTLPPGLTIRDAYYVSSSASARALWARYAVLLAAGQDTRTLTSMLRQWQQPGIPLTVQRTAQGRHRARNFALTDYISELAFAERCLTFRLRLDDQATPRLSEILTVLGLADPSAIEEVRRVCLRYDDALYERIVP